MAFACTNCLRTCLFQESGDIEIKVSLKGFNTTDQVTKHGFHIHKFGSISNGCLDAGSHYNPFNTTHGAPTDTER